MNTLKKYFAFLLILFPLAYLFFSPRFNKRLYRPLLFHPLPYPDDRLEQLPLAMGVAPDELYFNSWGKLASKETLHGWFFEHPQASAQGNNKVVLFSHGNAGNIKVRTAISQLLMECGVSVFVYDYRGFGKSTGSPSVEGVCQDGLAAYDFIKNKYDLKPDQIFVYGESLGSAVSCYIISQRKAAGLILQSGYSSLRGIAAETLSTLKLFPSWLFPMPHANSVDILSRSHPPLLIIHGKLDQVVAFHHAQALFDSASEPKQLLELPGSAHSDLVGTSREILKNALTAFIEKHSSLKLV
jgi:fermentation-respiration switch protein FrsA (DUF1100 family)